MFRVPNSWTEIRVPSSTSSWINGISAGVFHRGEAQISEAQGLKKTTGTLIVYLAGWWFQPTHLEKSWSESQLG